MCKLCVNVYQQKLTLGLYQKVMSDEIGCNLAKLRDDHVMRFVIFW